MIYFHHGYAMENILKKISAEYKNLTPSHQKIAQYLLHNSKEAILQNSTNIAKKAKVSESTVTRFVNNLGFPGFLDFRRKMGEVVFQELLTTQKLAESVETLEGRGPIFKVISDWDIENIRGLANQISYETFENTVEKLSSARSIYVLGLRSSYALAFYLAFNLRFFLDSVKLIKLGIGDLPEQLHEVGPDDVLVVISFKRYTREVVNITGKIKKKGTHILAITNSHLSPIAQLADKALIVETKIPTYIESYTAPMCLINALIAAIAIRKKDNALSALNKLENEFKEFQTFYYDAGTK